MFAHWFVVLVTNPEQILLGGQCQIVFCDSMFEMRPFVVESIRRYFYSELVTCSRNCSTRRELISGSMNQTPPSISPS